MECTRLDAHARKFRWLRSEAPPQRTGGRCGSSAESHGFPRFRRRVVSDLRVGPAKTLNSQTKHPATDSGRNPSGACDQHTLGAREYRPAPPPRFSSRRASGDGCLQTTLVCRGMGPSRSSTARRLHRMSGAWARPVEVSKAVQREISLGPEECSLDDTQRVLMDD